MATKKTEVKKSATRTCGSKSGISKNCGSKTESKTVRACSSKKTGSTK